MPRLRKQGDVAEERRDEKRWRWKESSRGASAAAEGLQGQLMVLPTHPPLPTTSHQSREDVSEEEFVVEKPQQLMPWNMK